MKCEKCGGALQIEEAYCTHCGAPNPFAQKHRADMKDYDAKFRKTESEVKEKTKLLTTTTVKIAIIAFLTVLIVVIITLGNTLPRKIDRWKFDRDMAKNFDKYYAEALECEENGEWLKLNEFLNLRGSYRVDGFREFRAIGNMATDFSSIRSGLMSDYDRIKHSADDGDISENDVDLMKSDARRMASGLDDFYANMDRSRNISPDYDEAYSEMHVKNMQRMERDMNVLLITYCGLSSEEVASLRDLSEARRIELFTEGFMKVAKGEAKANE